MRGFLLALDGLHAVFQWVVLIAAVGFFGFLWWSHELEWWRAILFCFLAWLAVLVVGVLYRIGTYPMRNALIRDSIVQAWKDGMFTEQQRDDAFKQWRSNVYWHLFFGLDPEKW